VRRNPALTHRSPASAEGAKKRGDVGDQKLVQALVQIIELRLRDRDPEGFDRS
jgi:hypothetical protein